MKLSNPIDPNWKKVLGDLVKRENALRCNPEIEHAYLTVLVAMAGLNSLVESTCKDWSEESDETF